MVISSRFGERQTASVPKRTGQGFALFRNGANLRRSDLHRHALFRLVRRSTLTHGASAPNNQTMARSETVRRVKSYSAATGYVYQYYFYEVRKTRVGGVDGTEYVYMVSVDRKKVFPLKVFLRKDALDQRAKAKGYPLSGTEEYAVAKIRLFKGFDEVEDLATNPPVLSVDSTNLEALLTDLDLEGSSEPPQSV